jgi:hypothetical protein
MMDEDERALVIAQIAGSLDFPSVYMGGPSIPNLRKAKDIVDMLERSQRLVATTCDHSDYGSYREHGIYCPRCGLQIREPE